MYMTQSHVNVQNALVLLRQLQQISSTNSSWPYLEYCSLVQDRYLESERIAPGKTTRLCKTQHNAPFSTVNWHKLKGDLHNEVFSAVSSVSRQVCTQLSQWKKKQVFFTCNWFAMRSSPVKLTLPNSSSSCWRSRRRSASWCSRLRNNRRIPRKTRGRRDQSRCPRTTPWNVLPFPVGWNFLRSNWKLHCAVRCHKHARSHGEHSGVVPP